MADAGCIHGDTLIYVSDGVMMPSSCSGVVTLKVFVLMVGPSGDQLIIRTASVVES